MGLKQGAIGNTFGAYWELEGNMLGTKEKWKKSSPCSLPLLPPNLKETRAMSHCGLAFYIKKYLKAKEELWLKYLTMQKDNLQKILKIL